MPAETQLDILRRMEGHLKQIADNGKRVAVALEAINAKTPNADGTTVAAQGAQ